MLVTYVCYLQRKLGHMGVHMKDWLLWSLFSFSVHFSNCPVEPNLIFDWLNLLNELYNANQQTLDAKVRCISKMTINKNRNGFVSRVYKNKFCMSDCYSKCINSKTLNESHLAKMENHMRNNSWGIIQLAPKIEEWK